VVDIAVEYGCHTFTKEWDEIIHSPDLRFNGDGEVRCFCFDRYELSKLLPAVIKAAPTARAYFSNRNPFMLIEDVAGLPHPYVVYFELLRKRKRGLLMEIRSAHPRRVDDELPVVTFRTLVELAILGRHPNRPRAVPRKKK
jgi:hypothetical protein